MFDYQVKTTPDLQKMEWALKMFPEVIVSVYSKELLRAGYTIERAVKTATVPVKTGTLKRSIAVSNTVKGGAMEVVVGAYTHYASYVEYGTKHFSGRYYMRRGLEMASPKVMDIMGRAMQTVVNTIDRKMR